MEELSMKHARNTIHRMLKSLIFICMALAIPALFAAAPKPRHPDQDIKRAMAAKPQQEAAQEAPQARCPMPPTLAFLQKPGLKALVHKKYGKEIGYFMHNLVEPAVIREAEYIDYIPVYHAQDSDFKIITDFLNRLYAWKYNVQVPNDFYMLRYWPEGSKFKNVQEFIDSFGGKLPVGFDTDPKISAQILSVNFSYFGNVNRAEDGEATFTYAIENRSCRPKLKSNLKTIFDIENLPEQYIDELIALTKKYTTSQGVIYQILLTPHAADAYLYLAHAGGSLYGPIYKKVRPIWGKMYVPEKSELIAQHDFDAKRRYYIKCSGILKEYCQNPLIVKTMHELQGRLLLSQNFMLNPASGVKVFRYTTLPSEKEKEYQEKLDALCAKIFGSMPVKKNKTAATTPPAPAMVMQGFPKELTRQDIKKIQGTLASISVPMTIVEYAEVGNWKKVMEMAAMAKTDLNARDEDGNTILIRAIYSGYLDVVKYLVELAPTGKPHVDLNAKDKNGYTVLILAANAGKWDIVKYLIELKDSTTGKSRIDLNAQNEYGDTVLMLAVNAGKLEIIKYLVELKDAKDEPRIDLNAKDNNGMTVLINAACYGKLDIVKYLVELKDTTGKPIFDLNAKSKGGKTALMFAENFQRPDIADYLRKVMKEREAKAPIRSKL